LSPELVRDEAHPVRRRDDPHAVAGFEHHVEVGEQVDVAATDPRDRRPVAMGEAQRRQRTTDDVVVRHDHPAEVET
jgi:hypothetical protein